MCDGLSSTGPSINGKMDASKPESERLGMSDSPSNVTVYSMIICPFAQRTQIHLKLKDIPFELVNLDICTPRPDWYLKLNHTGQVPTLINGKDVVIDSTIVSEYIEEAFPNPLPFGNDHAERARIRSLIKYADGPFLQALYLLMAASTPKERDERIALAYNSFAQIDSALERMNYRNGFIGDTFGLAEIAIAPFLLRYDVVSYFQDFDLFGGEGYEHFKAWHRAVMAHPVVRETAESLEDLIKLYEDYSLGYYNGVVPDGRERSSQDLTIPLSDRPLPPKAPSVAA